MVIGIVFQPWIFSLCCSFIRGHFIRTCLHKEKATKKKISSPRSSPTSPKINMEPKIFRLANWNASTNHQFWGFNILIFGGCTWESPSASTSQPQLPGEYPATKACQTPQRPPRKRRKHRRRWNVPFEGYWPLPDLQARIEEVFVKQNSYSF